MPSPHSLTSSHPPSKQARGRGRGRAAWSETLRSAEPWLSRVSSPFPPHSGACPHRSPARQAAARAAGHQRPRARGRRPGGRAGLPRSHPAGRQVRGTAGTCTWWIASTARSARPQASPHPPPSVPSRSSNNILVDEGGQLRFCDPSQAQLAKALAEASSTPDGWAACKCKRLPWVAASGRPVPTAFAMQHQACTPCHCCRRMHFCATWLWASCAPHHGAYDPLADLHALTVAETEVGWGGMANGR